MGKTIGWNTQSIILLMVNSKLVKLEFEEYCYKKFERLFISVLELLYFLYYLSNILRLFLLVKIEKVLFDK